MYNSKRSLPEQTKFLPFKPSWLNKLISPIHSSGYYVLLSNEAQNTLEKINAYQKLIVSQHIYALSSNPVSISTVIVRTKPGSYSVPVRNTPYLITYSVESGKVFVASIRIIP